MPLRMERWNRIELKPPLKLQLPQIYFCDRVGQRESLFRWERVWKIQRKSRERLSIFLDALFRWICTTTTTTVTVIFTQITVRSRYHKFTLKIRLWILKVKLLHWSVVTPWSSSMLRLPPGKWVNARELMLKIIWFMPNIIITGHCTH